MLSRPVPASLSSPLLFFICLLLNQCAGSLPGPIAAQKAAGITEDQQRMLHTLAEAAGLLNLEMTQGGHAWRASGPYSGFVQFFERITARAEPIASVELALSSPILAEGSIRLTGVGRFGMLTGGAAGHTPELLTGAQLAAVLSDLSLSLAKNRETWIDRLEHRGLDLRIEGYALEKDAIARFVADLGAMRSLSKIERPELTRPGPGDELQTSSWRFVLFATIAGQRAQASAQPDR